MKPFIQYHNVVQRLPQNDKVNDSTVLVQPGIQEQQIIQEQKQASSLDYIFSCPHCDLFIEVKSNEVNCCIFRHAYFFQKNNDGNIVLLNQLNPHAPKEECERLINEGRIYGCGKPFRIVRGDTGFRVEKCDYI